MPNYSITAALETKFDDGGVLYKCHVTINGHDAGHYYAIREPGGATRKLNKPMGDNRDYVMSALRDLEEICGLIPGKIEAETRTAILALDG